VTGRRGALGLAAGLWLAGLVTIGATWWDSGDQPTFATQLPALLVGAGAGLGLVTIGCLLFAVYRARLRHARAEHLLAAAIDAASGVSPGGPS
jgi:hypothetical protein